MNRAMALAEAAMNGPNMGLVKYDEMTRAIAECLEAVTAIDMRKQARALETMAHLANNREAEKQAAEIRIRAERKTGQLLAVSEKSEGGRPTKNQSIDTTGSTQTLADIGISKDQSSKWQQLAELPEEDFDEYLDQPGIPSTSGALAIVKPIGNAKTVAAKDAMRTTRRKATQDEVDARQWDDVLTFLTTRVREPEDEFGIHKKTLSGKRLKNAAEYLGKMYIADAGVSAIGITLKDGSQFRPTVTDIEVWQSAFPTLDIEEQLRQIAVWNDANPAKRKTKAGIKSHIFSWLSNVGRRAAFGSGECDVDENFGRHQAL